MNRGQCPGCNAQIGDIHASWCPRGKGVNKQMEKTMTKTAVRLRHRHGGTITQLIRIEHQTNRGKAFWRYIGRIVWDDGTISEEGSIWPDCLIGDSSNESSMNLLNWAGDRMAQYLETHGRWNGRHWVPHHKTGEEDLV